MSRMRGLPELRIDAGGTLLPVADLRSLTSVRVQQRLAVPAQCELAFTDPRGTLATGAVNARISA